MRILGVVRTTAAVFLLCGLVNAVPAEAQSQEQVRQAKPTSRTAEQVRPATSAAAARPVLQAPEVTIMRSDASGLVFEYRPVYTRTDTIVQGGTKFIRLRLSAGASLSAGQDVGAPDLQFRNFPVGVPSRSGNAVRVIASDYEDLRGVAYAPVPRMKKRNGMVDVESYTPDDGRYGANSFTPAAAAELSPVRQVRDHLIASVLVHPLQYNPAARTLRRYSRLVVEVRFGAAGAPGVQSRGQDLFTGMLLNGSAARAWVQPMPARKAAAPASSVLATGTWYRMTVNQEGIYRLDYGYLAAAGIDMTQLDPQTIRIYGNGGQELPEGSTVPRPVDLVENAIYYSGGASIHFATTDYILFYGKGTRDWTYDPVGRTFHHYINHYTESNFYWLTFGGVAGKRMQDQPSAGTTPTSIPDRFQDHVFIEEEKINLLGSGKDWYGQSISPNSSFTYVNVLPGLVPADNIAYRYTLVSYGQGYSQYVVKEWGDQIGNYTLPSPTSSSFYGVATVRTFASTHSSTLPDTLSTLNFAYAPSSISSTGYIDWVEVIYPRRFSAIGGYLHFRSADATNVVEYRLQNFTAQPMIFNVTAPADVRLVSGVFGAYSFRASETAGQVSEYVGASPASYKVPAAIDLMKNEDVRGTAGPADYIILTTQDFMPAATRLAQYRSDPAHGGLATAVVDVNQVYDEFAGGLPDATAMRDFLQFAYTTWSTRPTFVLLFGGASYDYKGLLGSRSSYVPTWQSPNSVDEVDSYSTDDFFAEFGSSTSPSLVLGRISSRSLDEANTVVDKIIRYESSSAADTWKMRVLYVADDSWTTEGEDGTVHTDDAEALAQDHTPDEIEKKKIYIADYPTVWTGEGRRKPGAYQDIIDDINQGALIVNFTGHGNPSLWAHEHIFEVETSIPQLVNADRLSFFFLATCNFSQFDDPKQETGSEVLMNKPDGGSIAVIAATRPVYQNSNAAMNRGTYDNIFTLDQYGRVVVGRPATGLWQYKAGSGNGENDQKYVFMGDPSMRLQFPPGFASIDSINAQPVDSANGTSGHPLIQLKALSTAAVSGTIRTATNQPDPSFNGTVSLVVNDADRTATILDFYPGAPPYTYQVTGSTIFHGDNSVANGKFQATFVIPRDLSYATPSARARLVGYVVGSNSDGAAFTSNLWIGGTDTTVVNNGRGPTITIYLNNRNFRTGDMVAESPVLFVDLADSAGINTSSSGIGHRIEAWVNNSTQSTDITDSYTSALNNFRAGTVQYQLRNLPVGRNTIRVRAWDSFDNSATAETYFQVSSSDQLTIGDVMNYPNPFASETMFTFRQNQSSPLDVRVNIYTVAGRLLQSIETRTGGDSFVRIPWDGRDRDGSILANGVYLYKLVVRTIDGRFSSEALGKMSVLK